jgi:hypothetical protein
MVRAQSFSLQTIIAPERSRQHRTREPEKIELYVHCSPSGGNRTIFESSRGDELQGTHQEIAIKYALADKNLRMAGYQRRNVSGGGAYRNSPCEVSGHQGQLSGMRAVPLVPGNAGEGVAHAYEPMVVGWRAGMHKGGAPTDLAAFVRNLTY